MEATEILELSNRLSAVTGEDSGECLALAKKIPPSFRFDAGRAATEGMTLQQIDRVFTGTFLSAAWGLNLASRDLVRSIVGAPTVGGLLTGDEFGNLMEIDAE